LPQTTTLRASDPSVSNATHKRIGYSARMSSVDTGKRQTCSGERCPTRHTIIVRGCAVHTGVPTSSSGEYLVRFRNAEVNQLDSRACLYRNCDNVKQDE